MSMTAKQARRAAKKQRRLERYRGMIRCDDCGRVSQFTAPTLPWSASIVIGWPAPGEPFDRRDARAGEVFVAWCPVCGCETATYA